MKIRAALLAIVLLAQAATVSFAHAGGNGRQCSVIENGIGGTGAPAEVAHGIGGTGMEAGLGSGIGGTGIQVAGVVTGLTGSAMAIDRNRQLFMLSKGSTVCPGDRIETGSLATVSIAFPDGGAIFLRPASVLQIDQYAWDMENPAQSRFKLTLIEGGLRSVSGKLGKSHPDAYRLDAPNATITVLGTDYQVISVKPGSEDTEPGTYAAVTSGRIRLSNPLGELLLGAGEAGMIRLNKAPAKLDSWPKCMVCR